MAAEWEWAAAAAAAALGGAREGLRGLQQKPMLTCGDCDIPCPEEIVCLSSRLSCLEVECTGRKEGAWSMSLMVVTGGVALVYFALAWLLAVVSIIQYRKKEADLPKEKRVLGTRMVLKWFAVSFFFGLIGFAVMLCLVSSKVNKNLVIQQSHEVVAASAHRDSIVAMSQHSQRSNSIHSQQSGGAPVRRDSRHATRKTSMHSQHAGVVQLNARGELDVRPQPERQLSET